MPLVPTDTKDTFPSTSEQSDQVSVTTEGAAADIEGTRPAGEASMPRVAEGDSSEEVAAAQAETTTPAEISAAASREQVTDPINAAGEAPVRATSESLHGGEY